MLPTILLSIVVIAVVGLIVGSMVKKKKRGESIGCSECGGACGGCALCGVCHEKSSVQAPEKL